MSASDAQIGQKRIEDLTIREIDMVYSLMRVGGWSDSEISRVYKVSVEDVHNVFDNYPQLRESCLRNPADSDEGDRGSGLMVISIPGSM